MSSPESLPLPRIPPTTLPTTEEPSHESLDVPPENLAASTREKMARAALVPAVMLMSSPVYAALPTMPTPGTGIGGATPADGDWLTPWAPGSKLASRSWPDLGRPWLDLHRHGWPSKFSIHQNKNTEIQGPNLKKFAKKYKEHLQGNL